MSFRYLLVRDRTILFFSFKALVRVHLVQWKPRSLTSLSKFHVTTLANSYRRTQLRKFWRQLEIHVSTKCRAQAYELRSFLTHQMNNEKVPYCYCTNARTNINTFLYLLSVILGFFIKFSSYISTIRFRSSTLPV